MPPTNAVKTILIDTNILLHKARQYTSVMSEKQWQHLLNLIPKQKGAGRPLELNLRKVLNAIFYVLVTGCQWRNLLNDYPNKAKLGFLL
jgi:transposase